MNIGKATNTSHAKTLLLGLFRLDIRFPTFLLATTATTMITTYILNEREFHATLSRGILYTSLPTFLGLLLYTVPFGRHAIEDKQHNRKSQGDS